MIITYTPLDRFSLPALLLGSQHQEPESYEALPPPFTSLTCLSLFTPVKPHFSCSGPFTLSIPWNSFPPSICRASPLTVFGSWLRGHPLCEPVSDLFISTTDVPQATSSPTPPSPSLLDVFSWHVTPCDKSYIFLIYFVYYLSRSLEWRLHEGWDFLFSVLCVVPGTQEVLNTNLS